MRLSMMCRIMQIEENVMPRWITACERHCLDKILPLLMPEYREYPV